jgi:hypothetical protein
MLFCGGSVVRGEGFPSSDLDVVVMFERVEAAWRESLLFEGWPIEVFAHDPETLAYFVAEDCKRGIPSLAHMISEALVVPTITPLSQDIQSWARRVLATPPGLPSAATLAEERYWLTDLLHDFRDDRGARELRAIACKLYPRLARFVLKTRGQWLGSEKVLPRLVARAAPELGEAIESAFERFFTTGDRSQVLRVVQQTLEPYGGELFEGFRSDAPSSFRVANRAPPWRIR